MVTYTEKGTKFNKFVEEKLKEIRNEFMKVFPDFKEENIDVIIDIKNEREAFMRFVNTKNIERAITS